MHRNRLFLLSWFLLGILTTCSSCSYYQSREALRNCKLSLQKVSISGATLKYLDLELSVDCENPSSVRSVIIDPFVWVLKSKGHPLATGTVKSTHHIPPKQVQRIKIPARVSFKEVGQALYQSIRKGQSPFHVQLTFQSPVLFFRVPHKVELTKE